MMGEQQLARTERHVSGRHSESLSLLVSCNDCWCLFAAYPWTSALNANLVHWLYLTDVKLPPDPKLLLGK